MKRLKIALGITLIATPFAALFGFMFYTIGWKGTGIVLGGVAIIVAFIVAGVWLLDSEDKPHG